MSPDGWGAIGRQGGVELAPLSGSSCSSNPPPPLERLRPPWPRLFWTTLVWSDREPPGGRRAFEVQHARAPNVCPSSSS